MTIEVNEGQRQAILLALAHLAVERPGWEWMLGEIAKRMDNVVNDRPQMFYEFHKLRLDNILDNKKV